MCSFNISVVQYYMFFFIFCVFKKSMPPPCRILRPTIKCFNAKEIVLRYISIHDFEKKRFFWHPSNIFIGVIIFHNFIIIGLKQISCAYFSSINFDNLKLNGSIISRLTWDSHEPSKDIENRIQEKIDYRISEDIGVQSVEKIIRYD